MALVISNSSSVQKPRIKPWMLKDFLMEDLGSCSSSGFRSFPRRQCCVAVRNLIETEIRSRGFVGSTSKSASSSASTSLKISNSIQRASRAVKLLPFNSPAPDSVKERKKKKKSFLPRCLSKKLFRKSLWKKSGNDRCEIERWISYQSSELSNETTTTTTSTAVTITSATTTSSTNSDSWSELESELTQPRSSIYENGVVAMTKRCVGDEFVTKAISKKKWSKEQEKEQLSSVSVLSFPDEDLEIESYSPSSRKINHLEGTKEKLMKKLRRFECLSLISRIKLEPQLSLPTNDLEESSPLPLHVIKEEETGEKRAECLLSLVRLKTRSFNAHKFNVDNLLISFFQEGLAKVKGKNQSLVEDELLIEAEDWLCGRSHDEVSTGWKMKEKRKVYVKDMGEGGEWMRSNFHELEKEEVSVQVEAEVFASLVDEMVEEFNNLELLNFLLK